jgi:CHAT domain-containing protein/tetratricopeptide (TPR) repeat protein
MNDLFFGGCGLRDGSRLRRCRYSVKERFRRYHMRKFSPISRLLVTSLFVLGLFSSTLVMAADEGRSSRRGIREKAIQERESGRQRGADTGRPQPSSAGRAGSLTSAGEKAYEAGNYQTALSLYEQALFLCNRANDEKCIAQNLFHVGTAYEKLGDLEKAFSNYEQSLVLARKLNDKRLVANNLLFVGLHYYANTGRYENSLKKAFFCLNEAMETYMALADHKYAAITMFHLGNTMSGLGKYEDAAFLHKTALKIAIDLRDSYGTVSNLTYLGRAYMRLGRYDDALTMLEQGLKIAGENNLPQHKAMALITLGDYYTQVLEYDKALSYHKEALELSNQLNLDNEISLALNNIAALYRDISKYDTALEYYDKSLNLSRKSKLNQAPMIASTTNNIGNVYASMGQYDKALAYYQESLKTDLPLQREHKISMTLANIGSTYSKMGQYDQALEYLIESYKMSRKLNADTFSTMNDIGTVYLKQKKYKEAEALFNEIKSSQGLVHLYLLTGRYQEGLKLLKDMEPKWNQSSLAFLQYYTLRAQALYGKGLLEESAQDLLKAVSIAEETRQTSSMKEMFFAGGGLIKHVTPYRLLVSVMSELAIAGKPIDDAFKPYGATPAACAFYFSELVRARTLLEAMAGSARQYHDAKISADLRGREEYLQGQLSLIESKWEDAFMSGKEVFEKLSKKKETLLKDQALLQSEIAAKYPMYAALKYPKPVSLQNLPLKQDEVLIEYALGDHESYAYVIRKNSIRVHKLNISGGALEDRIKALMEPLNSGSAKDFSAQQAKELYDILLSEAMRDIKPTEKLIMIPDGLLGLLPFEALIAKKGTNPETTVYVGDEWITSYYQSATALALTRQLKSSGARRTLFAIGNPVYTDKDPRYVAYKESKPYDKPAGRNLSEYAYRGLTIVPKTAKAGEKDKEWEEVVYAPLPETEDEVLQIAGLFGTKAAAPDVLLNMAANETGFRSAPVGDYRYLHFATHADMPGKVKGIKEPFIILGQVENKGKDDGFLTMSKVLELTLDADMVVLSACSTGKGRMIEGEGVASFARAFHHAGARSVVVSLWEVASEPAVEYMIKFYGYLRAGKSKGEALRLARNEMKAKYPNPLYWSVFILHGEG